MREAALHVDSSHSEGTDGLYNKIRTGIPSVRTWHATLRVTSVDTRFTWNLGENQEVASSCAPLNSVTWLKTSIKSQPETSCLPLILLCFYVGFTIIWYVEFDKTDHISIHELQTPLVKPQSSVLSLRMLGNRHKLIQKWECPLSADVDPDTAQPPNRFPSAASHHHFIHQTNRLSPAPTHWTQVLHFGIKLDFSRD